MECYKYLEELAIEQIKKRNDEAAYTVLSCLAFAGGGSTERSASLAASIMTNQIVPMGIGERHKLSKTIECLWSFLIEGWFSTNSAIKEREYAMVLVMPHAPHDGTLIELMKKQFDLSFKGTTGPSITHKGIEMLDKTARLVSMADIAKVAFLPLALMHACIRYTPISELQKFFASRINSQ